MDSEWIRNSIQKEGFTCTEAIIISVAILAQAFGSSHWLKLPFRFKILHPAHKRVFRVVGLGRSGSFRVALGS